ncbi:MAG: porin family protein [Sulfurimonas sp.]|nr:porin family protein [Sulfurimonas sp.]
MKYLLLLVLFFSYSFADRDGGPYIGVGYGVSQYDSDGLYNTLKKDSSKSITIYGGAYINKHFSVELGYVDFAYEDGYIVDDTKTLKLSLFSVSTLVHYPVWDDRVDFYAKFGAGQISYSDGSGLVFVFGVGTAVRFNDYVSLKFAYDKYFFGHDSTNSGSADNEMSIDYIYSAIEVQF